MLLFNKNNDYNQIYYLICKFSKKFIVDKKIFKFDINDNYIKLVKKLKNLKNF